MIFRHRLSIVAPLLGLGLMSLTACQGPTELELRSKITRLNKQAERRDDQIGGLQLTVEQLHEQLRVVRGWTEDDFKVIYTPVKIELAGLTGGADYDGRDGDDGITVYLKPIDREGDALKVAGDIRIELYDLQNPSGRKLIGEYVVPVEKVHEYWYGKFATYHYTIRCPWLNGPPLHDEITIRATFVDYLTQRVMTAQEHRKIKLAPRTNTRQ